MSTINYTKCFKCKQIIDANEESVEHNGKDYCFDCYDEVLEDEDTE